MFRFLALAWVLSGSLWGSATVQAQRRVDIERFRPAFDSDGFLGIQGTTTPGPWRWNLGLWFNYSKSPLSAISPAGDETELVSHRFVTDVLAQIGLGGRGAIGIDVPLVLHQSTDASPLEDGRAIPSQAILDPRIVLRVRVYGRDSRTLRERNEGPGLAIVAATTLPLGDETAFAGEGQLTFDLQAVGDFHVFGAGAGVMLGWRRRPHDRYIGSTLFRDQLLFGLGIKIPVPVTEDFVGRLELRGEIDARRPFGSKANTAVEAEIGASIRRFGITYSAGVGLGLSGGVGTPTVRALFGVDWAPRVADADRDGIQDDDDGCPHLPEDFDDFEDEDGCMDPDNDGDFIPDADDRCPNEPAEEGRDEDEDGCTDRAPRRVHTPPPNDSSPGDDSETRESEAMESPQPESNPATSTE